MKKTIHPFTFAVFISLILISCNKDWLGDQTKPKGRGEPGEIILVLDSARWSGEIGSEFRKIFRASVDGLPRDEPLFDLRHVTPFDFKGILKNAKNLMLVVPINDMNKESVRMRNFFTRDAIDSMRSNNDIFLISRKNLFATDQQVLFIIGHNDASLEEKIKSNESSLVSFFNKVEEKRAYQRIYNVRSERLIMNNIAEKYHFEIQVPFGWKIAEEEENFIWLRQAGDQVDKNIFVAFKPYLNENQFDNDSLIQWRNEIAGKYIYENPDKINSYMITEPLIPPTITEVNFNGLYAKKMIGRWKTNNISMGGPFVSYVFVDENTNRMYYLEAFLYSPGVNPRELVRELDLNLNTFRIESQSQS
jgi:hypothetical protein